VAGYVIEDFLIDIGLPEKYEEAKRIALSFAREALKG
jgi:hypothetical protein